MTAYDLIANRVADDVARLYVEARAAGLAVSHYPSRTCHTFDGLPEPGCEIGVFRTVGSLIFYKDERHWEVRAFSDASAIEMATLLTFGLAMTKRYGRSPGHLTRRKQFRHTVSSRTGKRIAWSHVCYRLDAEDLLATATAAEQTSVDDALRSILADETVDTAGWLEVRS